MLPDPNPPPYGENTAFETLFKLLMGLRLMLLNSIFVVLELVSLHAFLAPNGLGDPPPRGGCEITELANIAPVEEYLCAGDAPEALSLCFATVVFDLGTEGWSFLEGETTLRS